MSNTVLEFLTSDEERLARELVMHIRMDETYRWYRRPLRIGFIFSGLLLVGLSYAFEVPIIPGVSRESADMAFSLTLSELAMSALLGFVLATAAFSVAGLLWGIYYRPCHSGNALLLNFKLRTYSQVDSLARKIQAFENAAERFRPFCPLRRDPAPPSRALLRYLRTRT